MKQKNFLNYGLGFCFYTIQNQINRDIFSLKIVLKRSINYL